ncbi:sensor histidine kinase [Flavihumibacter petaseus]|uniref:Oxygen sensor histidine kinase NreB n=1 Tax=Flavihumibacter petaseus NBRC 106054 TaxID=1220578 RepID=A0A0E9N4K7_9BACT|nr:ATP-binding protein [Flavihumibacter petaseus]GAO44882.1 putative two-component histidine kinase [Flavihumibacter petaseus NBRC 106054]
MDGQETTLYQAILIVACTLGVILLYFFITLLRQQRINRKLFNEKLRTEIQTLEKERKRMAADLHDELGPSLLAIKFQTSSLDLPDQDDRETMRAVHEQMDQLLGRIREISGDLLPVALTRKGLPTAVQEFCKAISNSSGLEIRLDMGDMPGLADESRVHLFRIVQEIIHNTIKHARASILEISWQHRNNQFTLLTKDNGTGFNPDQFAQMPAGLGLNNIVSRAEILGGKLYLDSAPGKGTSYRIVLPC